MRSSDIAARCRETALRVEISGEWGELAETMREAADEVERLRLRPEEREAIDKAKTLAGFEVATLEANKCDPREQKFWEECRKVLSSMAERLGGGE